MKGSEIRDGKDQLSPIFSSSPLLAVLRCYNEMLKPVLLFSVGALLCGNSKHLYANR